MSIVEHKQDMENIFPSTQLDNFIENSNLKNAASAPRINVFLKLLI